MKGLSKLLLAGLFLSLVAVPVMRADEIDNDPTVYLGVNTVADNGAGFSTIGETTNSWLYPSSGLAVAGNTNTTWLSFQNNTGVAWTGFTIVATMNDTTGHSFTCDMSPFPAHGTATTQAYSTCSASVPTATTDTYTFSGGSVAAGQFLVFTWNNFPTNSGNGPLNFLFTATPSSTATPETSTFLLLGAGLLGLIAIRRLSVSPAQQQA